MVAASTFQKRLNSAEAAPTGSIEGGAEYENYRVTEGLELANKDQVDKAKTLLNIRLIQRQRPNVSIPFALERVKIKSRKTFGLKRKYRIG